MKMKILMGFVAVLLVGAAYFISIGEKQVAPARADVQQAPPAEVMVYTVKQGPLALTKDLPGRTSAYQVAEIRPQVSGIVIKRLFKEGSNVQAGQQLYQIDSAPYKAVYDSALADLTKAKANLKSAKPKAVRYAELVNVGGVSRQEYDDAAAALEQAKADIAVAEAAVATAKINLNYTKVFAPIAGRIGKSSVTEGALVTANQATSLATIQNLEKIYVDVNQSGAEIMKLRKQISSGEAPNSIEAQLIIDGEKEAYGVKGTIQFSDVTVDEGTGMVQLRILFPNPDSFLLPGLFVKARVEQSREAEAITVPQQSVVRNSDGSVVVWMVDKADIVNIRPIKVSRAVDDRWLVSEGLNNGDRVVVAGLQKIAPAVKVVPVEMQ